jgi:hypothetical protein
MPQDTEAQSTKRISGDSWFGSTSKEYHSKIIGYAFQKDERAFKAAMMEGIFSGNITLFKMAKLYIL